jgi:hypothetical protein
LKLCSLETNENPSSLAAIAFAFYMSVIISLVMCSALTYLNAGLSKEYITKVLNAYVVALLVGFFSVIVCRPIVVLLMSKTVVNQKHPPVND